jgi:hypothetical protein
MPLLNSLTSEEKLIQVTSTATKHAHKGFLSLSATHKERPSGDRSSLTSELESEMCHEALPMRQRPVKSPILHLGFSSSSELEESSLKKLRSLRAAHARDIISWNFFFLLSPKWYFFLPSPLSLESFQLLYLCLLKEESSFSCFEAQSSEWF